MEKEICKVIGCNNKVMDGDFGDPSLRYGYCQIHKIEGLVKEIKNEDENEEIQIIK